MGIERVPTVLYLLRSTINGGVVDVDYPRGATSEARSAGSQVGEP